MRRVLLALCFVTTAACSSGEIGSSCQGGVAENDCVEGAICTVERSSETPPPETPNNQAFFCRARCDMESDCEPGFACRRAEGTMYSSCQPEPIVADAGM